MRLFELCCRTQSSLSIDVPHVYLLDEVVSEHAFECTRCSNQFMFMFESYMHLESNVLLFVACLYRDQDHTLRGPYDSVPRFGDRVIVSRNCFYCVHGGCLAC